MAGAVVAETLAVWHSVEMVRDVLDGCGRADGCRDPAPPQS